MRLLYTASDGTLQWTKDIIRSDEIPPYAILSHTWGEQEVVFDDLKDIVNAQRKEGYQKIRFCARQAKLDGLDYFWVDTCCIDKANNTELSKAINSMFRWYQNAERCYVFLSDVEDDNLEGNGELVFRKSRWFNRGWTLQELLAPHSVEFFSKHGARLGDKESLKYTIHEVTGIPIEALLGSDLSEFDVAKRFSWAANRQTTEEEDGAYCLFGIFNVHLPLIYGEGKENALERLRSAAILKYKGRSHNQEERLGEISSWLSAPDPSTNYHKAHKQRQADTGLWLLESTKFIDWKESAASRLWLYGIPGCGKTILSSTIIKHLLQYCDEDTSMVTVYFYFDFNDTQKQNPELMLRSLLCQFLRRSVMIPKVVDALYSSCESGKRKPLSHALLEATHQVAQEFSHVYVVLDALDECSQRLELMDMLKTVTGWKLDNLHLLTTSRKERDIERSLESYVGEEDAVCLQRDVVDQDIQRYIQQRLHDDKSLAKWNKDPAIRQEIGAALMDGARGMFRWAVCQLDILGKCCNRAMLRKSLASLPQTLDQTYDRILTAINEEYSEYAIRILHWLTFSMRPLSVEEIAEVVAIDVARDPAFDRDEVLEDPLEVLDICSSLVTITTNQVGRGLGSTQQTVALAHYSVREYLVSDRIRQGLAKQYSIQEAECHNAITRGSLKYLMQLQQPLTKETLQVFALARYSAEFWSSHLRKTGDEIEQTSQLTMSLMVKEEPAYLNWLRLHDPDRPQRGTNLEKSLDSIPVPLYYAALLGFSMMTKTLLDKGADVNAQGGYYGNALQAASFKGHEQVVKILLNKGAEVNAQGGDYYNALQAASYKGHEQVVKMLLDKGADVNMQDGAYGNANALREASCKTFRQLVKALSNKGTEVDTYSRGYGNALQAASVGGHTQVVMMLLDHGAEINAQGGAYGTALQAASARGHKQVVKILLNKGAETNAQGGDFGNALYAASIGGYGEVVKMLLDQGADANAQGGQSGNALQAAAYEGHEQVVEILLNQGAEINAQGGVYGNALQAASHKGYEQIVETLLGNGADLSVQGYYGDALQAAAHGGHKQVVEMLLNQGADANAQGGRFGNALQAAAYRGHKQVVETLLNQSADADLQGGRFGNPLQAAAYRGHKQVVEMLLNQGADANAHGGRFGNPLQAAAHGGHKQIVEMLLNQGADANVQGGRFGNPLQAAAYGGHKQLLELLISHHSISRLQDYYGRTLIWWAAAGGNMATTETLINQYNMDPQTADRFGRKPSWIAAKKGYSAVLTLLDRYGGEIDREQNAPPKVSNDKRDLECDVCTWRIPKSAHHYHCNDCAGGNWDVCEDCRKAGATCVKSAHTLVKRVMLDEVWVEVNS